MWRGALRGSGGRALGNRSVSGWGRFTCMRKVRNALARDGRNCVDVAYLYSSSWPFCFLLFFCFFDQCVVCSRVNVVWKQCARRRAVSSKVSGIDKELRATSSQNKTGTCRSLPIKGIKYLGTKISSGVQSRGTVLEPPR